MKKIFEKQLGLKNGEQIFKIKDIASVDIKKCLAEFPGSAIFWTVCFKFSHALPYQRKNASGREKIC